MMCVFGLILIASLGTMCAFICMKNSKARKNKFKFENKIKKLQNNIEFNLENSQESENTSQNDMVMLASMKPENTSISGVYDADLL